MTDFRALCVELLDELKYQTDWSIAEELKERASVHQGPSKIPDSGDQIVIRLSREPFKGCSELR